MHDDEPLPDLVQRYAQRLQQPARRTPPPPLARVVAIDCARLAKAGAIVPGAAKTRLSEEFRIIKRPLLKQAESLASGAVILVTSCRPNEGKTFVAVNLALSLASERDRRVILVDADIYTRAALRLFGIADQPGLVDLLLDERMGLGDVLLPTALPQLSLLPAGRAHPSATELFASQRMAALIAELVDGHPDAIVVIDAPPVLASTEPAVLAAHAGQAILVTEYNRTPKRIVERALSMLAPCANIAFVINKIDAAIDGRELDQAYRYGASGPDV